MKTKDFGSAEYWTLFGRGLLAPDIRPTIQEAADYIFSLRSKVEKANEETAKAQHETKCANQQFQIFAMEVSNLANKYTR
jgi:hypothetical protein